MARLLWCRHETCGESILSVAGQVPPTCPHCLQHGRWTTVPQSRIVPLYADPKPPYVLTWADERFLKRLRIASNPDEVQG